MTNRLFYRLAEVSGCRQEQLRRDLFLAQIAKRSNYLSERSVGKGHSPQARRFESDPQMTYLEGAGISAGGKPDFVGRARSVRDVELEGYIGCMLDERATEGAGFDRGKLMKRDFSGPTGESEYSRDYSKEFFEIDQPADSIVHRRSGSEAEQVAGSEQELGIATGQVGADLADCRHGGSGLGVCICRRVGDGVGSISKRESRELRFLQAGWNEDRHDLAGICLRGQVFCRKFDRRVIFT